MSISGDKQQLSNLENQRFWSGGPFGPLLTGLKQALLGKESTIALCGPNGTGKSALSMELYHSLLTNDAFVLYFASPPKDNNDLQKTFIEAYPQLGNSAFIVALEKLLIDLAAHNRKAVLIFDQAEQLTPQVVTAIQVLGNLQTNTFRLLQIIFVGTEAMMDVLGKTGFTQRLTHRFDLPKLDGPTQLECWQALGGGQLSQGAQRKLLACSQGILERLTRALDAVQADNPSQPIAANALVQAMGKDDKLKTVIRGRRNRLAMQLAGAVAIPVLIAAALLMDSPTSQSPQDTLAQQSTAQPKAQPAITTQPEAAKPKQTEQKPPAKTEQQPEPRQPAVTEQAKPAASVVEEPVQTALVDTKPAPPQQQPEAVPKASQDLPQATAVTTVQASNSSENNIAVSDALNRWAQAWQSQDLAGYFAHYVEDFSPHHKVPHSQWVELRTLRINKPDWIKIELDIQFIAPLTADRLMVELWVNYEASNFSDSTLKQLQWRKVDGQWLIWAEHNIRSIVR